MGQPHAARSEQVSIVVGGDLPDDPPASLRILRSH